MFLQGLPGVKEITEPEFAGFSISRRRVSSIHQGPPRRRFDEVWTEQ
jgi:hypothetical protein